MLIVVSSLSATVGSMSKLSAIDSVAVRSQCMDATSIEDWLESFTDTVGRKVSSSLNQRREQLRIRVINQKEIGMLSSEWQTLSLSQPMQKEFLSCTHSAQQADTFLTTYAFIGNFDWQMILSSKHQILSDITFLYQCCNNCLKPHPKGALATLFY